jgi:hypothetical protein
LIKAAAPVADPPPGYVLAGTTVHFTSATEGARVYLSSTGALPELDSKGDAIITEDITILAFARAPEGYEDSDEVSFEYRVKAGAVINLPFPPIDAVTSKVWDYAGGVYTIHDGADVTVSGSTTANRIVVNGTATVTPDNASITLSGTTAASPLDLADGANLTLRLAGTNTLTASGGAAGVHVPEGRTLTITSAAGNGQTSGTLTATGGGADNSSAGIGGGDHEDGGNITITGGVVNATGGPKAAGIGGGDISVTGGTITATAGAAGAGIGGGTRGPAGQSSSTPTEKARARPRAQEATAGGASAPAGMEAAARSQALHRGNGGTGLTRTASP